MSGGSKHEEPRFDGVAGPFQGIGLPGVRTLSDEYRDDPEPEGSDRVPPPPRPGLIQRFADRLRAKRRRG